MSKIRLYTFPFAGGSKYSFNNFRKFLPDSIEFFPLELPGRGERMMEPLCYSLSDLTDDLFTQITKEPDVPFAFYGHSMGTSLAWLLTHRLKAEGRKLPHALILTGAPGPSFEEKDKGRHLLPTPELKEKLMEYGGSPSEVLQDDDLFEFFEPILRADFQAVETYKYQAPAEKLELPFTIMIGEDEETTVEEAMLWQNETKSPVDLNELPGQHFFIFDHSEKVAEMIAKAVKPFI